MSSFLKTILFLGTLSALFVAIGYAVGGSQHGFYFFLFSLVINIITYWFSEKIALSMAGAKLMDENKASQLFTDIRMLCQSMNIPMPQVYSTPDLQANAFATGRNPKHSSICLTQGILQLLNRHELNGVIAHELAHIKNRDVLIATIAAVLASAISAIADAAFWFGGSRDHDEQKNPVAHIVLIIFAPIAAFFIQMAISRQREYAADFTGAISSRRPMDLAKALEKIEQSAVEHQMNVNPALASLYIENPLKNSTISQLFSTHPPTAERIERLQKITP